MAELHGVHTSMPSILSLLLQEDQKLREAIKFFDTGKYDNANVEWQ